MTLQDLAADPTWVGGTLVDLDAEDKPTVIVAIVLNDEHLSVQGADFEWVCSRDCLRFAVLEPGLVHLSCAGGVLAARIRKGATHERRDGAVDQCGRHG